MAGERDSGYGFVHFEEGEEGVSAAFKAIHTITTAGIINDVEYVCEASQNLLRQVQMMNKARGQYIDPATGDFVRPAFHQSGPQYMDASGSGLSRSREGGMGMGPMSTRHSGQRYLGGDHFTAGDSYLRSQERQFGMGGGYQGMNYDAYSSDMSSNRSSQNSFVAQQQQQFRQPRDLSGPQYDYLHDQGNGRSGELMSGGFYGNRDVHYSSATTGTAQMHGMASNGFVGLRSQGPNVASDAISPDLQGLSAGQYSRHGASQVRSVPEYVAASACESGSQNVTYSLDASVHSSESPPGYSSKAFSVADSPPGGVSSKSKFSQSGLSAFGLDTSAQGTSSTSLQVDISAFMSGLRFTGSDTEPGQSPPAGVTSAFAGDGSRSLTDTTLGAANNFSLLSTGARNDFVDADKFE